ncbi:dTDP-4-dehydrorhamnose reductase [Atopobacter phocae]|uniref:dTDP-4-dehydrorhamnose reductase n=1 Tax=Atopobacter phocae TaxID=136492 RepID=UPI000471E446|nr:dTDP-4-dehydrorhamnose reductase [Atopobacter phocae]
MKTLIIGKDGQLGMELANYLTDQAIPFEATDLTTLDITDGQAVATKIRAISPEVIYLCAAYTAVDRAENEGKELNWQVNVEGTKNVGKIAEELNATLVFLSTDYVFNWSSEQPIPTEAAYDPLNEYGRAKQYAEEWLTQHVRRHYIIRTSWVFGQYGHNFMKTMQKLAQSHHHLTVVNDQFGRPTWTKTLVEFMYYLVNMNSTYGIYHLSNQGMCSWYEFASYILKDTNVTVEPVSSDAYPQQAKRPTYSVLDLSKTLAIGFKPIDWKEAVDFLR